ncbi:RNA polymerase II elongation factor ELL2-like [Echinops telfairi]|uniref:RNA polymerase II elongation factor ELL2-like n=1 Tax=Echinops telfairi TaxID=9371 RepID=A0ABM0ZU31_ECHTE|nr:RNA polymerase II elongation factor ELL2-like [Echinops telfairi]
MENFDLGKSPRKSPAGVRSRKKEHGNTSSAVLPTGLPDFVTNGYFSWGSGLATLSNIDIQIPTVKPSESKLQHDWEEEGLQYLTAKKPCLAGRQVRAVESFLELFLLKIQCSMDQLGEHNTRYSMTVPRDKIIGEAQLLDDRVPRQDKGLQTTQALHQYQLHRSTHLPGVSTQVPGVEGLSDFPPNLLRASMNPANIELPIENESNHEGRVAPLQATLLSSPATPLPCWGLAGRNFTRCRIMKKTTQAEGKSHDVLKKMIKPPVGQKVPIQGAGPSISESVHGSAKFTSIKPPYAIPASLVSDSVYMQPYIDRVIHLLALKDYKISELSVRLQRDGIHKKDKCTIGKVLEQVAILNPRNFTYTLKDYLFKEVRRDWPGYTDSDRQLLDSVLARKGQAQTAPATKCLRSSRDSSTGGTPPKKVHFPSAAVDSLERGKGKISHLTTVAQPPSTTRLNKGKISHPMMVVQSPSNARLNKARRKPATSVKSPAVTAESTCALLPSSHRATSSCSWPGTPEDDHVCQDSSTVECQQDESNTAKRSTCVKYPMLLKKTHPTLHLNKTHKHAFIENQANSQTCTVTKETQETDSPSHESYVEPDPSEDGRELYPTPQDDTSTSEVPDYLTNYVTVVSSEQRQRYVQDFTAESEHYHALRDTLYTLSLRIFDLKAKEVQFSPGTKEYEDINKEMSREFQKLKQKSPNYHAEEERCYYLYNKLTHIKRLVRDFDQKQRESCY